MSQLLPGSDLILEFDPFTSPHKEDPWSFLMEARQTTPVFYSEALGTWVITRYDDIMYILRDPEHFSSGAAITNKPGPPPPPVLDVLKTGIPYSPNSVDLDPPMHTQYRGFINKAFSPRRINDMEPRIVELANELVDAFVDAGETDFVKSFAYPLPTLVIAGILGIPREDMADFKRWSDEWVVLLGQLGDMDRLVVASGAVVEFQLYIARAIDERRAEPRDDLISDIVAAADELEEPPNQSQLVSLLMTVLFAGHETTTNLIANTLKQLCFHPDVLAIVQADRGLIPSAITESIRIDPPVPAMYRTTTADVEVAGVAIPAGSHIQLNFASANRDPGYFKDADSYDIYRDDMSNLLSFGRGIHYCVGASLSQLEGRVALNVLFDRLPGLQLKPGAPIVPMPSATIRGTERLDIIWDV